MPIEFRCQACQRLLHTPDYAAGGRARCPECGAAVPVPAATSGAAAQPVEVSTTDRHALAGQPTENPAMVPPAALDPNAPALRDTPSKHASDTDYPVRPENKDADKPRQFETTLGPKIAPEVQDSNDESADDSASGAEGTHTQPAGADAFDDLEAVEAAAAELASQQQAVDIPLAPQTPSPAKPAGTTTDDASATKELEVGEILSTSWKAFIGNLVSSVGVGFVAKLMFAGGVVALVFAMIGLVELIDHGGDEDALIGAFGIVAVFSAFFLLVSWLYAGICLFVSNISHGHAASFLDLFRGGRFMYRMLGASFIFGIAVAVGLAFFILPGLFIFLRFCLFGFFVVDRDMGPIQALRSSHRVTGQQLGKTALTLFAIWALWHLISVLPFGVFVSTPLAIWMLAVLYFRLCNDYPDTGERTAAFVTA